MRGQVIWHTGHYPGGQYAFVSREIFFLTQNWLAGLACIGLMAHQMRGDQPTGVQWFFIIVIRSWAVNYLLD